MKPEIQFDEERHIYSFEGQVVPGVTEILSPITAGGYSKINPAVLEHAAAKGTLVHDWCEMYDYGCAEEFMPSEVSPYCEAYIAFVRDYVPMWETIEGIVYNPYLQYAGRLDRFGMIDGKKSVLDIKTVSSPSTRTHISVCCQTAAYAVAIDRDDFDEIDRYALYLKPDGTYRLFDCKDYEKKHGFIGIDMFFALLRIHEQIEKIGRRKK